MRTVSWIVLALAGGALVAGAGFLLYLNWAFTPRSPASSGPSDVRTVTKVGPAGEGLYFAISELRTTSSTDLIYDVTLASSRELAAKNEGDTVVRAVNAPVPMNVTRVDASTIEVEFASGPGARLTIPVHGWLFYENGALQK